MSRRLPEFIDPFQLVEKRQTLKGAVKLSTMQRLASLVTDTTGVAELEIYFGRDEAGLPLVKGSLSSVVRLQCQRCLEELEVKIDTDFVLGVVSSLNEAGNLPENYEPLVVGETPISLTELLEDEILLALPAVAIHSQGQCAVSPQVLEGGSDTGAGRALNRQTKGDQGRIKDGNSMYNASPTGQKEEFGDSRQNPFAVLEQLKGKLNK